MIEASTADIGNTASYELQNSNYIVNKYILELSIII